MSVRYLSFGSLRRSLTRGGNALLLDFLLLATMPNIQIYLSVRLGVEGELHLSKMVENTFNGYVNRMILNARKSNCINLSERLFQKFTVYIFKLLRKISVSDFVSVMKLHISKSLKN